MKKIIAILAVTIFVILAAAPALASTYLANTKSRIFHYYDCPTIKHHNAAHFIPYESRQACTDDGYRPCRKCNP